jgi:hypothetical protein
MLFLNFYYDKNDVNTNPTEICGKYFENIKTFINCFSKEKKIKKYSFSRFELRKSCELEAD